MKKRLLRNGYKENYIDTHIKKVIDKQLSSNVSIREKEEEQKQGYILKVQYGQGFEHLKSTLKNLLNTESQSIHVIGETVKAASYLSTKCRTPKEAESNLVYRFKCHGCDAQYIGETKRHLRTRVAEHRLRSRDSAIKDHNLVCDMRNKQLTIEEFSVVDKNFPTWLHRKYTEALYIKNSHFALLNNKCTRKPHQLNLFY